MTKVRFAPSPTGLLHIGSARTALFNFLIARQEKGKMVLRIEDTDRKRSKKEYEENIYDSLRYLGIEWDELYKQSERTEIYSQYLKKLLKEGKAYYCFCSSEDLEAQRQYYMSIGEPPVYNGCCRNLSSSEVKKNLIEEKEYIIRFKTPSEEVTFPDIIRGEVRFQTSVLGDFSLAKSLKEPLYNFACVVDDHEMGISKVIRGEDHIPNTPKQILIYMALGWEPPLFAHLPLILAPDHTKLSKRFSAVSVTEYRKAGYLPEALINFLAFLGWNPGTEKEIYSLSELIKDFSLERIKKSGAIFNLKRLNYLNALYLRKKSPEELAKMIRPFLKDKEIGKRELEKAVTLYQDRFQKLSEAPEILRPLFSEKLEYEKELLVWKGSTFSEIKLSLDTLYDLLYKTREEDWRKEYLEKVLLQKAEEFGKEIRGKNDRGYLLWPLRVALTGQKASAGPFEIAEYLGKESSLSRIKEALKKINEKE